MTKKLMTLLIAAVTALSLAALAGCGGPSSEDVEKQVTESLTSQFDAIKNLDSDFMDSLGGEEAFKDLEDLGITAEDFAKAYFGDFDYAINSVEVNDDQTEATAEITLTVKSFKDITGSLETVFNDIDISQLATMSEDELNKWVGDKVMEVINSTKAVTLDPISLTLAQEDGTWDLDSASESTLEAALMAQ